MTGKKTYMILLVDRKKVIMFTVLDGKAVGQYKEIVINDVPQKVKASDAHLYGRSDKIFRHIEEHLHRHLQKVADAAAIFAQKEAITGIIVGGHHYLFGKIQKHLPQILSQKVKGSFVTDLKCSFNDILQKAKQAISGIEQEKQVAF